MADHPEPGRIRIVAGSERGVVAPGLLESYPAIYQQLSWLIDLLRKCTTVPKAKHLFLLFLYEHLNHLFVPPRCLIDRLQNDIGIGLIER